MNSQNPSTIKVIIGLGNPGKKFEMTRHNIGFRVVDALVNRYHGSWQQKSLMELSSIDINGRKIVVIKPQTFMNASGKVIPDLLKQGIKPEQILVVHDELELPFGKIAIRLGGSARGHNGLKSIIEACGADFYRMRWGIARPENKEDVPDYVLKPFTQSAHEIENGINAAVENLIVSITH